MDFQFSAFCIREHNIISKNGIYPPSYVFMKTTKLYFSKKKFFICDVQKKFRLKNRFLFKWKLLFTLVRIITFIDETWYFMKFFKFLKSYFNATWHHFRFTLLRSSGLENGNVWKWEKGKSYFTRRALNYKHPLKTSFSYVAQLNIFGRVAKSLSCLSTRRRRGCVSLLVSTL